MFRAGQKVVCIDDSGFSPKYGESLPMKGHSYTIRNVEGSCVRLREIVNKPAQYAEGLGECLFKAARFKRGK